MRKKPILLAAFLTAGSIQPALAGIRPSFSLEYSSWNATHILEVVTTDTDGLFHVIETWKGDVNPGDEISVPAMSPLSGALPIAQYPFQTDYPMDGPRTEIPRQPPGSRIFLFLKESSSAGWEAAGILRDFKASAVWVEAGRLYCFYQIMNPGPTALHACENNEDDFRTQVKSIAAIYSDFVRATSLEDLRLRAGKLAKFARSSLRSAQVSAIEELGKCGSLGLPQLSNLLDDPNFSNWYFLIIKAIIQAGGDSAGPVFMANLKDELSFWQVSAPRLLQSSQPPSPLDKSIAARYSRTLSLVGGLAEIGYGTALETVVYLRQAVLALAQQGLGDSTQQIVETCDRFILKHSQPADGHQPPHFP